MIVCSPLPPSTTTFFLSLGGLYFLAPGFFSRSGDLAEVEAADLGLHDLRWISSGLGRKVLWQLGHSESAFSLKSLKALVLYSCN